MLLQVQIISIQAERIPNSPPHTKVGFERAEQDTALIVALLLLDGVPGGSLFHTGDVLAVKDPLYRAVQQDLRNEIKYRKYGKADEERIQQVLGDMRYEVPQKAFAVTAEEKLSGYLLNPEHADGGSKAKFLEKVLGYNKDNWGVFSDKLYYGLQKSTYDDIIVTNYGVKFIVPMQIEGETGKMATLKTVWQIDEGKEYPKFVTISFYKRGKK